MPKIIINLLYTIIIMIFIAHRGNTEGPNPEKENNPDYILSAIKKGYYAEIDVWVIDRELYLGHDEPQYKIDISFIENNSGNLFCHCKNIFALNLLLQKNIHCFFHNIDDYTLTSKGIIWAYPNRLLTENSIAVMPEWDDIIPYNCYGVCTDYPELYLMYNKFANKYNKISSKNATIIKNNGNSFDKQLLNIPDNRYCVSITGITDIIYLNRAFYTLLDNLKSVLQGDISYMCEGVLHHTVMQVITFTEYNKHIDYVKGVKDKYSKKIIPLIKQLENIKISLNGIVLTKDGIILKGYPDKNINKIRENIRLTLKNNNLVLKEPYKADTSHITLYRFTNKKDIGIMDKLRILCEKYNNIYFGSVRIKKYNLGSFTWKVRNNIIYC